MPLMAMDETSADARERTLERIGDFKHLEVLGNKVLAAIYVRPSKTRGGIILTEDTREEDIYQGKVALVLAAGPSAFVSDDRYDFRGLKVEPGDWIVIQPSDGWAVKVNNKDGHCRLIDDVDVKMKVKHPDLVW